MNEPEKINENPTEASTTVSETAAHAAKMRKRIIIVFTAMVAFAVLYFSVSALISHFQAEKDEEETYRPNTIIFHEADYEYDILKDKDYLALDRMVYYCDLSTGVTVSVGEKNLDVQDDGFKLLYRMIDCIIRGDHEQYNSLFSSNYYASKDNQPEEEFTMQQVYGIKFSRVRVSERSEGGVRYVQYEYEVEYKIRKNNGTFRTDIGSDASRKQYFVMSDSTVVDGEQTVLIDSVIGYNYQNVQ